MNKIIDLRSDTVTKPTIQMRRIMAEAEVGDDVFQDDPTVVKLEQKVAQILDKEAALYVPSGTMANQISLRVLCNPGDEVICERKAHIVFDEVAAAAALSGIMLRPVDGENGELSIEQIRDSYHHPDIHRPNSRLVALENTHNRAGGKVLDLDYINSIASVAQEYGLGFYLDGRVTAVLGTHTHIPTADAQILSNGTAYITDVGMVGSKESVLGMDKNIAINRFLCGVNEKFEVAEDGVTEFSAVLVTIDLNTNKAKNIERIYREV